MISTSLYYRYHSSSGGDSELLAGDENGNQRAPSRIAYNTETSVINETKAIEEENIAINGEH